MMRTITLLLFLILAGGTIAQGYNPNGSLLWEIKSKQGTSYLFGTLHSNDKQLFELPDSVYITFLKSNKVALEVNVLDLFAEKSPIPYSSNILLDKKGRIYTSSEEPTSTYYGNEDGMPQFMDAWFQEKAELLDKQIIELETIAQQTKAIEEIPFIESINRPGLPKAEPKIMQEMYLQGKIEMIDYLIKGGLSGNSDAYYKLIENRNKAMAIKLSEQLKEGGVFCAVGAGHLNGENGLLNLLRSMGYSIRQVNLTRSQNRVEAAIKLNAVKSYEFTRLIDSSTIRFIIPGKPRERKTTQDFIRTLSYKELGQGNTYEVSWVPRDSSISLLEYAEILIASPPQCPYVFGVLDDGTEYTQGLSDSYSDGVKWTRIIINDEFVVVASCSGGNKFMNSDRPTKFFNTVILE